MREFADIVDEKVDFENSEKILRVDIIRRYAGVSVLA
jgi:tRNA(Ser,Leu) C12 N-acetylase TAN1